MGLDMSLTRKEYVKDWDHTPEDKRKNVEVFVNGRKIDTKNLDYLEFTVIDWRKANHIHQWFVYNCQDGEDNCKRAFVNNDKLKELMDLCTYILKDRNKAEELLPTQDGFFFGSTEYDQYYFESLEETVGVLEKALREYPNDEYIYQSSW
jgi:hypothetical protein